MASSPTEDTASSSTALVDLDLALLKQLQTNVNTFLADVQTLLAGITFDSRYQSAARDQARGVVSALSMLASYNIPQAVARFEPVVVPDPSMGTSQIH